MDRSITKLVQLQEVNLAELLRGKGRWRTGKRSRNIGFWSHPSWPLQHIRARAWFRGTFPSVREKGRDNELEGLPWQVAWRCDLARVTLLNLPSQLARPYLDFSSVNLFCSPSLLLCQFKEKQPQ